MPPAPALRHRHLLTSPCQAPRRPLVLLVGWGLASVGCDSKDSTAHASDAVSTAIEASQTISCRGKPGVTPWSSRLTVKGAVSQIVFVGVQPPGATAPADVAPAQGDNTFVVEVKDGAGGAVTEGNLKLVSTMPEHSHPPPPAVSAKIVDGKATLPAVKLFMAGLWQLTFTIEPTARAADTASVSICLEG